MDHYTVRISQCWNVRHVLATALEWKNWKKKGREGERERERAPYCLLILFALMRCHLISIFKQNIGLDHIWSTTNSTVSLKTSRNIWYFRLWECNHAIVLFSLKFATYRSATRQMNHVFCSVQLKSIPKFRWYIYEQVTFWIFSNFGFLATFLAVKWKNFPWFFTSTIWSVGPSVHQSVMISPLVRQPVSQSVSQLVSWPY